MIQQIADRLSSTRFVLPNLVGLRAKWPNDTSPLLEFLFHNAKPKTLYLCGLEDGLLAKVKANINAKLPVQDLSLVFLQAQEYSEAYIAIPDQPVIEDLIAAFPDIKRFTCDGPLACTPSLSQLFGTPSQLTYLDIELSSTWRSGNTPILPSLQELRLCSKSKAIAAFLENLGLSTQLQHLSLVDQNCRFGTSSWPDIIPRFTLKTLELKLHQQVAWPKIKVIFQCKEITKFSIRSHLVQLIGDDEIDAIAKAWPKLECLNISTYDISSPSDVIPRITLEGLAHLVPCPNLRQISASVDARLSSNKTPVNTDYSSSPLHMDLSNSIFTLTGRESEDAMLYTISFLTRKWPMVQSIHVARSTRKWKDYLSVVLEARNGVTKMRDQEVNALRR